MFFELIERHGSESFLALGPTLIPLWVDQILAMYDEALLERFGESRIESWADDVWEAFTLQALWRVCEHGVSLAGPGPRTKYGNRTT